VETFWTGRVVTLPFALVGVTAPVGTMVFEIVFAPSPVLRTRTPKKKSLVFCNPPLTSPTLLDAALPMFSCPLGIAALAQHWT